MLNKKSQHNMLTNQQMVPKTGLEPVQYRYRRILSPLRLPISPLGQLPIIIIYNLNNKINSKF